MFKKSSRLLLALVLMNASLSAIPAQTLNYAKWGAVVGAVPGLFFLVTPSKYLKETQEKITFSQKLILFGTFEVTAAGFAVVVGHGAASLNRAFGLTAFAHAAFEQLKQSKWKMS